MHVCSVLCPRPSQTGESTVRSTYQDSVLRTLSCSENLSLNRVADDTNPDQARTTRLAWERDEGGPLLLHLQCPEVQRMGGHGGAAGGSLDTLLDLDTWVSGPTTPFPGMALTSVHLTVAFAH